MHEDQSPGPELRKLINADSLSTRVPIAQETLLLLAELANELVTAPDFEALKQILIRNLRWIIDFDCCTLAVQFEPTDADYILFDVTSPSKTRRTPPQKIPLGEGWPGQVLLDAKPYFLSDLTQLPDLVTPPVKPEWGIASQANSLMLLPLRAQARTLGCLSFSSKSPGTYSMNWRTLASLLGSQISEQLASILAQDQLKRAYEFRERVMESTTDAIYTLDLTGNFTLANQRTAEMTGRNLKELIGTPFTKLFAVPEQVKIQDLISRVIIQGGAINQFDLELRQKQGQQRLITVNLAPLTFAGEISAIVGSAQDITQRKQAEAALLEVKLMQAAKQGLEKEIAQRQRVEEALLATQARLQHLLITNPTVIYSRAWDNYDITFVSENVKAFWGYEAREFTATQRFWADRIHPEDAPWVFAAFSRFSTQEDQICEYRFLHKDRTYRWIQDQLKLVRDSDGNPLELVGSWHDIHERKRIEEQLRYSAFYDALTDLPNRALFMNRLEHAVDRVQRQAGLFAILFLDLDRFKVVNDSLGHSIGDQLLIAIADRLKACLRPEDTVARLGGDEFAILLEQIQDIQDPILIAQRVQKQLAQPLNLSGHEVFTTTSIGIALSTTPDSRAEELLRDADTAMYRAKSLGKDRYEIFDAQMHANAVTLLQLETDLRWAVDRQEFLLHYQPIVSLETGKITGFEALLRWQHPQRGLISPGVFIPIAEETGLIVPISWWVLDQACRQMHTWQAQFSAQKLSISVNLSSKLFLQTNVIAQVDQVLSKTGLAAASLKLEITETVLAENTTVAEVLSQLRSRGVQVYLDDFGTGYSSLSYLHQFPIDVLKIDRSFVKSLGSSEVEERQETSIVQSIVVLARNLHMQVIAEGIETAAQLAQLQQLNCGYGQGYFFSRPLDSKATTLLLQSPPQWWAMVAPGRI